MTSEHISWNVKLTINDGKSVEDLKALAADMSEFCMANEPDCLAYEWHVTDDGNGIHVHERYKDNAAIMTHLACTFAKFKDRFFEVATPIGMDIYGKVTDEVKEAAAGFAPVYYERFYGFHR